MTEVKNDHSPDIKQIRKNLGCIASLEQPLSRDKQLVTTNLGTIIFTPKVSRINSDLEKLYVVLTEAYNLKPESDILHCLKNCQNIIKGVNKTELNQEKPIEKTKKIENKDSIKNLSLSPKNSREESDIDLKKIKTINDIKTVDVVLKKSSKIRSKKIGKILAYFENKTQKLPIIPNYESIFLELEDEYFVVFQYLVSFCSDEITKSENESYIFQLSNFSEIFIEDQIFQNIDFIKGINSFNGFYPIDTVSNSYLISFNTYLFDLSKKSKVVISHNSYHYCEYVCDKLNPTDSKLSKGFILISMIAKLIKTEEYQIICSLLPEFENYLNCHIKKTQQYKDKKFIHFVLGSIFYKFYFLRENIKEEIKKNLSKHTDYYIDSPILLSFVTGVQTFLISTLIEISNKQLRDKIIPVLMLKTFLNFISIHNITKPNTDFHLCINLIDSFHFTNLELEGLKVHLNHKNQIYSLQLTEGLIDNKDLLTQLICIEF